MRDNLESLEQVYRSISQAINMTRAVFMDRDGTLNVEKGYLLRAEDVELLPKVGEAIHKLNWQNVPVVVVTNQSAFARGFISLAEFEAINSILCYKLKEYQAHYDALYYCPHLSACECRKPQPGLLLQAAVDLHLNLGRSYMIGDKLIDIQAGQRAGCQTILVKTGWGSKAIEQIGSDELGPEHIADGMLDAVEWILSQTSFTAEDSIDLNVP